MPEHETVMHTASMWPEFNMNLMHEVTIKQVPGKVERWCLLDACHKKSLGLSTESTRRFESGNGRLEEDDVEERSRSDFIMAPRHGVFKVQQCPLSTCFGKYIS